MVPLSHIKQYVITSVMLTMTVGAWYDGQPRRMFAHSEWFPVSSRIFTVRSLNAISTSRWEAVCVWTYKTFLTVYNWRRQVH